MVLTRLLVNSLESSYSQVIQSERSRLMAMIVLANTEY